MDPIDNLNFGKDSSTKFKLKLDNSKVKLAAPETSEETNSKTFSAKTAIEENRVQKIYPVQKTIREDSRTPFYEEDYYMNNATNYNARLIAQRESLQFDKTFGLDGLYALESTQLKNMQVNVPIVVKASTGQLFYMSNNKLEPGKISAEEFVRMNVNHQNTLFDVDKTGFNSFAPRRRRRGTLKGFKNAKQASN